GSAEPAHESPANPLPPQEVSAALGDFHPERDPRTRGARRGHHGALAPGPRRAASPRSAGGLARAGRSDARSDRPRSADRALPRAGRRLSLTRGSPRARPLDAAVRTSALDSARRGGALAPSARARA